jgi:phosphate transport system substrate-binding protein
MLIKGPIAARLHRIVFGVAMTFLCAPFVASAGEIRIAGTGNALGTMRLLGAAYVLSHPESTPIIRESIGTSGAIKAVMKGAIEIGLSSRELTDEEVRHGLRAVAYAHSPTVFAVQQQNGTVSITRSQIADIYSGKMMHWSDGTRVRPILRQREDDNSRQIKILSPEIEKALSLAEQRQGMAFAVTDQEAADKMESIQGSFGVTTLALIRSEERNLKALALDEVAPTPENAQSGRYPMMKRFYFVLPQESSLEVQEFIKFVKSSQGGKILEQTGHTIP